jgi:nucleoside-diphosphate-sugar epimerase
MSNLFMPAGSEDPMETINNKPTCETVLVTGISGFIAGHIALQLQERGYAVRGTLRRGAMRDKLEGLSRSMSTDAAPHVAFVEADLRDDKGWAAAVDGCDYVIHTASPFPSKVPKDENDLIMPARDGALRVLRAAQQAGVKRVVMTSSIAATNHGKGAAPFTEADWTDIDGPRATPYYKSKTIAEKTAWDFAASHGLDLAVINPGMVLGPLLGKDFGTSVGLVRQMMNGAFSRVPHVGFPVVDVRDVADAHIRAMTNPAAGGQRFIAAGGFLWMTEISAMLANAFPAYASRLPAKELPDWMVKAMAIFSPMTRLISRELSLELSVDTSKSRRVLGWHSRPDAEAIRASAQSLIDMGLIDASAAK